MDGTGRGGVDVTADGNLGERGDEGLEKVVTDDRAPAEDRLPSKMDGRFEVGDLGFEVGPEYIEPSEKLGPSR